MSKNQFIELDDQFEIRAKYSGINDIIEMINDAYKHCNDDPKAFKELLEDAEKPLYLGSTKYTKISGIVKLYCIKGKYGWSNSIFSKLLSFLKDILPDKN